MQCSKLLRVSGGDPRKHSYTNWDDLSSFFSSYMCLPWWVGCGTAIADDAGNDLLLLKVIASYHDIDGEVAK